MDRLIREFIAANPGKPKIILVGEDHGGDITSNELVENVGKQAIIFNTLKSIGQPFSIYHELPAEQEHLVSPSVTCFYLKKAAQQAQIPFHLSSITLSCRTAHGSCDDLYTRNILSHINPSESAETILVAVLGALHVTEFDIPSGYAVLRLNSMTESHTNMTPLLLRKSRKYSEEYIDRWIRELPFIPEPTARDLGISLIAPHFMETAMPPMNLMPKMIEKTIISNMPLMKAKTVVSNMPNDNASSFKPIWLKNSWGDWIIQCPECNRKSGSMLEIPHSFDCPNKNKKPDLRERPTAGGKRRKTRGRCKKRNTRRMYK